VRRGKEGGEKVTLSEDVRNIIDNVFPSSGAVDPRALSAVEIRVMRKSLEEALRKDPKHFKKVFYGDPDVSRSNQPTIGSYGYVQVFDDGRPGRTFSFDRKGVRVAGLKFKVKS
jgi:hypothetical protein